MSEQAKKAEPVGSEEPLRFGRDGRRLSPDFIKHIGNPDREKAKERRAKRRPLTEALERLVENNPELADLAAIKLWKLFINEGNMKAAELIFNRLDGLVKTEKRTDPSSMRVVVQNYQGIPAPQEAPPEPPVDVPQTPEADEAQEREAWKALRRMGRKLPQAQDILGDRWEDDGLPKEESDGGD